MRILDRGREQVAERQAITNRYQAVAWVTSGGVDYYRASCSSHSRGQARAIEQALIERNPGFENAINSISQRHCYYGSAVDWGEAWLQSNGY